MSPSSDRDNICPVVVVSSHVSPETKDVTGMDEAVADQRAARDLAEHARAVGLKVEDLRKRHIPRVVKKARELQERIEQGDAPLTLLQEYDALMDEVERLYDYRYSIVASAMDWRHTTAEVRSWFTRAMDMGCLRPQVGKTLIEDLLYCRKVPNAPFRERYLELRRGDTPIGGDNPKTQAILGHETFDRILGVRQRSNGSLCLWLTYEQGVELARILDMTPIQAGI